VRALIVGVMAFVLLAGAAQSRSATTAGAAQGLTGTWICCGAGGAAAQVWVISGSGGEGRLPGGDVFSSISASLSGNEVDIVTTYNGFAPGYVATFKGTLSDNGASMSGTWESNKNQHGTWTATRSITASLAATVSMAKSSVAVGGKISVEARVTARGGDVTGISLGDGLRVSPDLAEVTQSPAGLAGFDLAKGESMSFTFTVVGKKAGKATVAVDATELARPGR
jgi:hypothetical protein